jgi:hypothetical protein
MRKQSICSILHWDNNTSDWCNNYMGGNPNYRFTDLKQAFYRHYRTMKNDEHVYLQLKNLKQKSIERIKVYNERLLKLVNSLQNTYYWQVFDHSVPIKTTILFTHYYCRSEARDSTTPQKVGINMWKRYFYAWNIKYTLYTTNHKDKEHNYKKLNIHKVEYVLY